MWVSLILLETGYSSHTPGFYAFLATAKSKSKEPPPSAPVPNSPVPSPVKTSDLVSKPKSKLLAGPIDDTPQDAWSLLTGHKSEVRASVDTIKSNKY